MLFQIAQNYNNYRSDIDGLRAIAVLSVILFHINAKLIPGGFVGVDIFFVISGYLITLHILRDLKKDKFSIVEFYQRRVKRIAPAMLAVVLVSTVLAQLILRPSDAEKVAESGLWSLLSMANVYFWLFQDTSYFAAASNEILLLHLWSLGVEEQFYIFWPLILLATYRVGHGNLLSAWRISFLPMTHPSSTIYYPHGPVNCLLTPFLLNISSKRKR
jgi:peptidoglycan/LPS O-acetylase OafA/YrhL